MANLNFSIYSFYRFCRIANKKQLKNKIEKLISNFSVKGTILLADEGINGTIAGKKNELNLILKSLKKFLKIRKIDFKENESNQIPFNRMKVRLKKEIVSLGQGKINVCKLTGKYLNTEEWEDLISKNNTKIIDVRNNFEIKIGKFKNAINPKTSSFREFPVSFSKLKINKNDNIAMYCTGGIRCEKASSYLKKNGYKNVFQLKGGILNYLNEKKKMSTPSFWNGSCFVFDERVAINRNLKKGSFIQCYGCRRPIKRKDTYSQKYVKGVSCPYCFDERNEIQKSRSRSRQAQIDRAKKNRIPNIFLKNSSINQL